MSILACVTVQVRPIRENSFFTRSIQYEWTAKDISYVLICLRMAYGVVLCACPQKREDHGKILARKSEALYSLFEYKTELSPIRPIYVSYLNIGLKSKVMKCEAES